MRTDALPDATASIGPKIPMAGLACHDHRLELLADVAGRGLSVNHGKPSRLIGQLPGKALDPRLVLPDRVERRCAKARACSASRREKLWQAERIPFNDPHRVGDLAIAIGLIPMI